MKVGIIIDLEKEELFYVLDVNKTPQLAFTGIPSGVSFFISTASELTVSIVKYRFSYKTIEKYINKDSFESKKPHFHSLCWSRKMKGEEVYLNENRLSFYCEEGPPAHVFLSQKIFTDGVHLVEFFIDKVDGSLFLGIADASNMKSLRLDCCPKSKNSGVWALGPSLICHSSEHLIEKPKADDPFNDSMTVGMIIDMSKKELSYYIKEKGNQTKVFQSFSDKVAVFVCSIGKLILTISNYIDDPEKIEKYLKEKVIKYHPSDWINKVNLEMSESHPIQVEKKKLLAKKNNKFQKRQVYEDR
eukprot:TRINITY_DN16171_c0_g1_i1.p1 TRINITY_DN16171_c0_g1~~TRINITY_DN16171_c0_g1_i1.p1  ORF type:complete len:301 (-),score=99.88 TRINITY_DN16171_c0_g1_i1:237-1139(-)